MAFITKFMQINILSKYVKCMFPWLIHSILLLEIQCLIDVAKTLFLC